MRSPDAVNISSSASEQQNGFTSNRIKSTLRAGSGTIQDAYVLSCFLDESLAFFVNVAFLCKALSCMHLSTCSFVEQFTVNSSLFVYSFVSTLGLFLTQFLSLLFSGS